MRERRAWQSAPLPRFRGHLRNDMWEHNCTLLLRLYVRGKQVLGKPLPRPGLDLLPRRHVPHSLLSPRLDKEGHLCHCLPRCRLLDPARSDSLGLLRKRRPSANVCDLALADGRNYVPRRSSKLRSFRPRTLLPELSLRGKLVPVAHDFPLDDSGGRPSSLLGFSPRLSRASAFPMPGSWHNKHTPRLLQQRSS